MLIKTYKKIQKHAKEYSSKEEYCKLLVKGHNLHRKFLKNLMQFMGA